jgi:glycosyltransferase involved in cell wall biosynthesis
MHDIISERAMEFKKFNYAGQLYELNAETELAMLEVYDHVIAICIPDKEKLDGMLDPAKVLLCPHPVEQVSHSLREQVQYIVFVASAYLPNRDGINHFIRECWPIVSAKFPHVLLTIYGTVCAWVDLAGNQNISLKGFVPDLANIYESADIAINPVRFGAGMKIKNIEALANGIPLVTTMHGARGLESITDKGFLVANGFSEFTEILLSMIGDLNLRQTLSDNGRKFVEQYFSVENCFNPLLQIIENN